MRMRPADPRDTTWEQEHATYRVSFWDVPAVTSAEYEVTDTVDVIEVLAWAEEYAARHGLTYTVYATTTAGGSRGLIRLAGVLGDPFAEAGR